MTKPAVFSELDWVVYAETKRDETGPLGGNLTDRPAVLNEENHQLTQSELSFKEWQYAEQLAVLRRDVWLRHTMGLHAISYPNPVHGVNAISVNDDRVAFQASLQMQPDNRPDADAIATQTPGFGISISSADCIVMSIADDANRSVGQIHTGYVGIEKRTIEAAFSQLPELNPSTSHVYLSSHARLFPIYGEVLERFRADKSFSPYVDTNSNVRMSSIVLQQLLAAGVRAQNIQLDSRDTFTDPTLFSFRERQRKGANGRNGLVIGIKAA